MKKLNLIFVALVITIGAFAQSLPLIQFTSDSDHFSTNFLSKPDKVNTGNAVYYTSSYEKIKCSISVYKENSDVSKAGVDKYIDGLKAKYGKNLNKDKKTKLPNVKSDNAYFIVEFEGDMNSVANLHVFMHNNKLYFILYVYPSTMMTADISALVDFEMTYFDSFKFTN